MKLLAVDDEADLLSLVEFALEIEPDFEPTLCSNSEAAQDLIAQGGWDIFMIDLMMPPPGGEQLLEQIRANPATRDLPVVICTAETSAGRREKLLAAGATDVLAKPYSPLELADYLRKLVAGAG